LKEETLPVGTKIGFNSSKTNFSEWSDFFAEVNKSGLVGTDVSTHISFREINHDGRTWGVVTFKIAA